MRLAEVIDRWIGKVEIVLAGADEAFRDGEDALAAGDAMRARAAAHRVLARAPESVLGLALLADACEAGGLDAELALTLEQLARLAPSRAEIWARLGHARQATRATPDEIREAWAHALAAAEPGSEARVDALVGLADLDIAQGEGARAELWLERVAGSRAPDVLVRRAEARLLRGDPAGAVKLLDSVQPSAVDGRAAFALGRALAMLGDARAFVPLVRATVLDVAGASEALSAAIGRVPNDEAVRARVRSVVDAKGEQDAARWRAAFARAEGNRRGARQALRDAVAAGDAAACGPLLDAAVEDRDGAALRDAVQALSRTVDRSPPLDALAAMAADARRIVQALDSSRETAGALDALAAVEHSRLREWAGALAEDVARSWIPASGARASWALLLARLDAHAHAADDGAAAARVGDLAAERSRPVRLAVIGEFNAGKSTFINALIGSEVAPTGVLPTTATVHHLRWAPAPFAKIFFARAGDPERIVALGDLRATLKALPPESVARVEIRLPLPSLVRVEILDTPGLNAPDARHTAAARAAFDEADVALWLLDATQPLKQSERAVWDEARRIDLPLQILVNKADRLAPADLVRVMQSVGEALAEGHLTSWRPPLAFSAKQALASKLGGPAAIEASGWPSVESLLERDIVARSDELKERALRRRAAGVVAELLPCWQRREATEAAGATDAAARGDQAARAAARIEADGADLANRIVESLEPHAKAWTHDADLVVVGRDPQSASNDRALVGYRVDGALARLAPPLSFALAALAPEGMMPAASLLPAARAIVRAAVSACPFDTVAVLRAVAISGLATLSERLLDPSTRRAPAAVAAGVVRELRAFASALEPIHAAPPER